MTVDGGGGGGAGGGAGGTGGEAGPKTIGFRFSTKGGSEHITYAEEEQVFTRGNAGIQLGGTAGVAFNKAIGVNGDTVEGVDKVVSKVTFSITKRFHRRSLPPDYLRTLELETGSVNQFPFTIIYKGQILLLHPGEVRFDGADAPDNVPDHLWEFTFDFEVSRNLTRVQIFNQPPATLDGNAVDHRIYLREKKGWWYLWLFFENAAEPLPGAVGTAFAKRIRAVVLDRIYEERNWRVLRLQPGS